MTALFELDLGDPSVDLKEKPTPLDAIVLLFNALIHLIWFLLQFFLNILMAADWHSDQTYPWPLIPSPSFRDLSYK